MQIKSCLRRCEKEIFKGFTTCCAFYEFHDHKLCFLPPFKLEIFHKVGMKQDEPAWQVVAGQLIWADITKNTLLDHLKLITQ